MTADHFNAKLASFSADYIKATGDLAKQFSKDIQHLTAEAIAQGVAPELIGAIVHIQMGKVDNALGALEV
jgi:Mn-containing catalase